MSLLSKLIFLSQEFWIVIRTFMNSFFTNMVGMKSIICIYPCIWFHTLFSLFNISYWWVLEFKVASAHIRAHSYVICIIIIIMHFNQVDYISRLCQVDNRSDIVWGCPVLKWMQLKMLRFKIMIRLCLHYDYIVIVIYETTWIRLSFWLVKNRWVIVPVNS